MPGLHNFSLLLVLPCLVAGLIGCSEADPRCPAEQSGPLAASAGCFATSRGRLLLVQGYNGEVSLPGGSSEPGESARCTAFRETWEETGLALEPGELLQVFDTGFHLYRCEATGTPGAIDPPVRFEVRDVLYLGADRFADYQWRFEEQRELLREMLSKEIADSTIP
jgi:8-oxo-dGTP diphosphatase